MDTDTFDIESLVHLEQSFYDTGYTSGHAHGRIHGLIEGRALGREKGFEMWEELGYYLGWALVWKAVYDKKEGGQKDDRTYHHIKHLLELIAQFPRVNPSSEKDQDLDIPKLFRQIRSRYKALCASLGVKPSLRASSDAEGMYKDNEERIQDELVQAAGPDEGHSDNSFGEVGGGKKMKKMSVWKVDKGAEEMSF